MFRTLRDLVHSIFLRAAFCSQGEHKRETIASSFGHLVYRCSDCGRTRDLGPIFVVYSNRKVRQ
jgi:uncharacterized Zn finger protein